MADQKPELEQYEPATEQGAEAPTAPELKLPEPPAVPPPLTTEFHQHDGPRWPTILAYLAVALIVAFLIVLATRAIYHHFHHRSPKPPAVQPPPPPSPEPPKHHKKSTTPKQPTPNTGAVPNTGAGNTIALFAGVSLAAAGLHYIYQLRKTS